MKNIILFIYIVFFSFKDSDINLNNQNLISNYYETVEDHKYMMHALGGINGDIYINSIDSMENCYDEGQRLFEVDLSLTLDNKIVLAHSNNGNTVDVDEPNFWTKDDWEKKLGQKYDVNHPLATFDEFMNFKIQNKYAASSFYDLVNFIKSHDDVYVLLDVGNRSYNATKKIYNEIVLESNNDNKVLQHFIVGGHTIDMIKAVKDVYNFKFINLYFADKNIRQQELETEEKFLQFCKENGVTSFSTSRRVIIRENPTKLLNSELISYVFTIDDEKDANSIFLKNVDVIGTNFLR